MTSRLAQMQARFQQKQMQEKEERLLKLYENQQQRTIERVSRGSAESDSTTTTVITNVSTIHGGKVRQMFDERRQKAGIDRSYPLEPLKTKAPNVTKSTPDKNKNIVSKATIKSTVQKSLKTTRNGKPAISKQETIKRVYTNENGNENFEERRDLEERNDLKDETSDVVVQQDNDFVSLMNSHNLNDNIDKEEMPIVGLDEVDDSVFIGKLANVGGTLPSQNDLGRKLESKTSASPSTGSTLTNQIQQKKSTVQKTVSKPKQTTPNRTTPVKTKASVGALAKNNLASPNRPNMSAKRPPQHQDRVPSTNRPSARQTPRGTPSAVTKDDLATCKFCNRRFAPDRLQTHEDICARTGKKKRKAYDAMRHRVQGTELEPFARKSLKVPPKASKPGSGKKANWRQTHDEFISSIRAAKMAQSHLAKGGKLSDLPPPPPSSNPDYVQCPHCGRKFNETAAARHIPKCATYEFNKPKSQVLKAPGQKASGRAPYR